jgi:hypothetical protein
LFKSEKGKRKGKKAAKPELLGQPKREKKREADIQPPF